MFIPWDELRVCSAWLTRMVNTAQAGEGQVNPVMGARGVRIGRGFEPLHCGAGHGDPKPRFWSAATRRGEPTADESAVLSFYIFEARERKRSGPG